jgi:hypothetical protein
MASFGVLQLNEPQAQRSRRERCTSVRFAVLALVVGSTLPYATLVETHRRHTDSRVRFARWAEKNLPSGATLVIAVRLARCRLTLAHVRGAARRECARYEVRILVASRPAWTPRCLRLHPACACALGSPRTPARWLCLGPQPASSARYRRATPRCAALFRTFNTSTNAH